MVASVRRGTREDSYEVAYLGRLMQEESPRFSRNNYSAVKVEQLLNSIIDTDMGAFWVAEDGENIVGFFIGVIYQHYFCYDLTATDLALYIEPKHRGGMASIRMIKEFEKWAFEKGAKDINLGISTELNVDRTSEIYQRLGYSVSGVNTIKFYPYSMN